MTSFTRFLIPGLMLGLMACSPSSEVETAPKPVAPSTPAPEDRRYNPAELALDTVTLPRREERDA